MKSLTYWKRYSVWMVAVMAILSTLIFAGISDQRWEDYYITLRASRNLAEGHGLVFSPGQKIHSFTSPLGVLIPAGFLWLVGTQQEEIALWLFRCWSALCMAVGVVYVLKTGRAQNFSWMSLLVLCFLVAFESKSVAFSANGMETGMMLMFLSLSLYALLGGVKRPVLWNGLAWAGLMWTRPDSCVYIGAMAAAFLIFHPMAGVRTRWGTLKIFFYAGLVCTVLYLPWVIWAWWYYGNPIPHTVFAKALMRPPPHIGTIIFETILTPVVGLFTLTSLDFFMLPPYASRTTEWPVFFQWASRILMLIAFFALLGPGLSRRTRFLSLYFIATFAYVRFVTPVPYPWYLPPVCFLAVWVFISVIEDISRKTRSAGLIVNHVPLGYWIRLGLRVLCILVAGMFLYCWSAYSYHAFLLQQYVEFGTRKAVGLYLKQQSKGPTETVFLEPLGYSGYYSGLKMYDYPGLSSPEVLEARRRLKTENWNLLIEDLKPDWLVLRVEEARSLWAGKPRLLDSVYELEAVFDGGMEIKTHYVIPGMTPFLHDSMFFVYRKKGLSQP